MTVGSDRSDGAIVPLPIGADEFDAAMAGFGAFEDRPRLALAVSGGADSMALAVLARRWADAAGGTVHALVVDHGLRPESGAEATDTIDRLRALGIPAHLLEWQSAALGHRFPGGLQAAAREARLALMSEWCRHRGILHLLTGHNRTDAAETMLLRLARGSGLRGLAGMAARTTLGDVRVLRPLIGFGRERLEATLRGAALGWINDPSNRDRRFDRARIRGHADALDGLGLGTDRLVLASANLARAAFAIDAAVAERLVRTATLHPLGWISGDRRALVAGPAEIGLRVLAAAVSTIGGQGQTPRLRGLDHLRGRLLGEERNLRATLAGSVIDVAGDRIVIAREWGRIAASSPIAGGRPIHWDNRFRISVGGPPDRSCPDGTAVVPLDDACWAAVREDWPNLASPCLPPMVRASLPALVPPEGGPIVPLLPSNDGRSCSVVGNLGHVKVTYRPVRPLTGCDIELV